METNKATLTPVEAGAFYNLTHLAPWREYVEPETQRPICSVYKVHCEYEGQQLLNPAWGMSDDNAPTVFFLVITVSRTAHYPNIIVKTAQDANIILSAVASKALKDGTNCVLREHGEQELLSLESLWLG